MNYLKLSDCAIYAGDRISISELSNDNYISTENMLPNRGGSTSSSSLPETKNVAGYIENDILVSNIRPYFKKIWLAKGNGGCSNDVLVVRAKKEINPRFLYYALSDSNFFNYATATAKGTKMPRGSQRAIMKYLIPDIDNIAQAKIANILSAYDDAIENNNRRIKILEQLAENLYKEWFVRMRFPGHETAEYENGLPKGWKRNKIDAFYKTSSGGTPSRTCDSFFSNGTINWIKTGELRDCVLLDTEEKITELAIIKSAAKKIPENSLLMAMYGVNIGQLGITCVEATCNQACCVFQDKQNFSTISYLFQYLKSIRDYLLLIGFGAAQQNLSQDLIRRIKIVMPSSDVILRFEKAQNILRQKIVCLSQRNILLSRQRNLLLPRLLSGKMEVLT